jgi:t-SNARE complex subunit (syntaxin)
MTDSVMDGPDNNDHSAVKLRRKQRRKNLVMLLILFGWAIMLYVVAIVKMGGAS